MPYLTPKDEGTSTGSRVLREGLNTLGFLSSGERFASAFAPALRKNRLTAGVTNAIGNAYANAPTPVRFLADNLLSPIGLASTVFAPVTGGTSLGLKGALGTAARLSTRLAPEAAVAAGAGVASHVAQEALPEGAPTALKIAVPLLAGFGAGAAAARGIKTAIDAAQPAIVRAGIVDLAQSKGLNHVPYMADYEQVKNDVGSDSRLAGMLLEKTGIDPSAAATAGSTTQKYLGLIRMRDINTSEVAATLMNASPTGFKSFNLDNRGLFTPAKGAPVHWNDLMEYKDAPTRFGLNPAQTQEWQTMHAIAGEGGDIDKLRVMFGLKPRPKVDMGEGKQWFHREALTKDGKRMPRPSDPTEARLWDTAEEAANAGEPVNYADPLTNVSMQLKANLDEIADHLFERDVIASGATAPKAVLATPQGRVAHGELRKSAVDLKAKTTALQEATNRAAYEVDALGNPITPNAGPDLTSFVPPKNITQTAWFGPKGEPLTSNVASDFQQFQTHASHGPMAQRALGLPVDTASTQSAVDDLKNQGFIRVIGGMGQGGIAGAELAGPPTEKQLRALTDYFRNVDTSKGIWVDGMNANGERVNINLTPETDRAWASKLRQALGTAPEPTPTTADIPTLQKQVEAAQQTYQSNLEEWNKLLETKFSLLPANVVGGKGTELVPVNQWRGIEGKGKPTYLKREDVDAMSQWFSKAGITGPQFKGIGGAAQQVGDMMRYFSATADVAAPMMQGLPLLASDPVAWGKMAAQSYKALFDTKVQGTYIRNNFNDIADMVIRGRVPIASSELFAALHEGGLGERALNLPGLRQTLRPLANRFENGYDTTLLITRAEMWKAMKGHFPGTDEQLGQVVRNMTGGMDTKGLGVGPTQRGLESMFLFAPKLLRSSLALVGQAAKPWTPGGMEAAHRLLRMTMAGAGTIALVNTAVGISNGESEAQIEQRIADALDPTKGRQFLGVKVGDNWYGMGGQFRSVAQMVYRGITDPASAAKLDSENPLVHYASGRVSPLAGLGLATAELATDEKLNLLPFQTVDSFPDVAQLAGTGMMPFMIQSLVQNHGNVVPPLFEFFGARTSTLTPTDVLDAASQRTYNLNYRDLTGQEQEAVKAANPDAVKQQEALGSKAQLQYRVQSKQNDQRVADLLVTENNLLQAGRLQGGRQAFRQNVSDALHDRYLRDAVARQTLGLDSDGGADSPKRQVLDAYFQTFTDAGYTPDGGQVDWNKWDELQSSLQIDIAGGKFGNPTRAQQFLDQRTKYEPPPEVKWFFDNKDYINNSGYWDQKEVAFQKLQGFVKGLGYDAGSEADLERMYQQALEVGDPRARQLQRLVNRVGTDAENIHQRMRRADPRLNKALVENGYVQQPKRQFGTPI